MFTLTLLILLSLAIIFSIRAHRFSRERTYALRERDQISFLLESLNDGLVEYDGDMRVVRINQTAETLLGIHAPDVIGKTVTATEMNDAQRGSLARITFPGGAPDNKATGSEYSKTLHMSVDSHELSITTPEAKRLRIFTIPKLDAKSNKPTGFIKIVRDITRDDIISHSKSDLVAVVAHQLRTPLSGTKWVFRAMLDGDFGALNDEQKKMLTRGLDSNEDMIHLVDDILDVSRIEEANFGYTFVDTDILALVQEVVNHTADEAAAKRVTIKTTLPPQGVNAKIDAPRIRMALSNILDNAISYSPDGAAVEFSLSQDSEGLLFKIRDYGIGIPESSRSHLFSKFYRAENAKRTKPRGTGLGLFLVQTVISGHGGKVWVESKEGAGSTFFVRIPLTPSVSSSKNMTPTPDHVFGM